MMRDEVYYYLTFDILHPREIPPSFSASLYFSERDLTDEILEYLYDAGMNDAAKAFAKLNDIPEIIRAEYSLQTTYVSEDSIPKFFALNNLDGTEAVAHLYTEIAEYGHRYKWKLGRSHTVGLLLPEVPYASKLFQATVVELWKFPHEDKREKKWIAFLGKSKLVYPNPVTILQPTTTVLNIIDKNKEANPQTIEEMVKKLKTPEVIIVGRNKSPLLHSHITQIADCFEDKITSIIVKDVDLISSFIPTVVYDMVFYVAIEYTSKEAFAVAMQMYHSSLTISSVYIDTREHNIEDVKTVAQLLNFYQREPATIVLLTSKKHDEVVKEIIHDESLKHNRIYVWHTTTITEPQNDYGATKLWTTETPFDAVSVPLAGASQLVTLV